MHYYMTNDLDSRVLITYSQERFNEDKRMIMLFIDRKHASDINGSN